VHNNRGEREESSSSRPAQTESSGDAAHHDTPPDGQLVSQHVPGSHTQRVEVEVHESSDQGDSELKCAPSSIRSHELNKAESVSSSENSREVSDQATITQRSPSHKLIDGEFQHIVTNDGK
jgi:hypothetical protein